MLKSTFLIALSFFAANTTAAFEKRLDVEIRDSDDAIHWVSPHVLLIKALVPAAERVPGTTYRDAKAARLLRWNLVSDAVDWVSDSFVGRVCYADGRLLITDRITYDQIDERSFKRERFWVISGTLRQQSKLEVSRQELREYDFDLTCQHKAALPAIPTQLNGKLVKRLRPGHGFVELELESSTRPARRYPVRLHPPGSMEGDAVEIDLLRGKDIAPIWPYLPFREAYWVQQYARVIPQREGMFRSWWLFPDGTVNRALHYDVRRAGDAYGVWSPLIPFRDGFVRRHARWAPNAQPGHLGAAGLYRFDPNGKHTLLVRAAIGPIAVSADGCSIGFGYDDRLIAAGPGHFRVAVINVCDLRGEATQ